MNPVNLQHQWPEFYVDHVTQEERRHPKMAAFWKYVRSRVFGWLYAAIVAVAYFSVLQVVKANEEIAALREQVAAKAPAEKCSILPTAGLKFCIEDKGRR